MTRRRPKPGSQDQKTDSARLAFGPEFTGAQCLLISEVNVLLAANRRPTGTASEIVEKTHDYCARFSKFYNQVTIKGTRSALIELLEIRQLFEDAELDAFEQVQLANLCCGSAEEAKILIPR
jgi:DNA-directed RNA polymerase II subunit RPB4